MFQDEDCKDFRKKEKEKYPKSPGEVVAIYNPEKNVTKESTINSLTSDLYE